MHRRVLLACLIVLQPIVHAAELVPIQALDIPARNELPWTAGNPP